MNGRHPEGILKDKNPRRSRLNLEISLVDDPYVYIPKVVAYRWKLLTLESPLVRSYLWPF
jgi:hypothetical protein